MALPVVFSDGKINAITLATDRPGGFATAELAAIDEAMPVLARLLEVHAVRRTARTLLETYVGRHTGARVLEGLIRRGDGEDIHAVIWFCDLRSSTIQAAVGAAARLWLISPRIRASLFDPVAWRIRWTARLRRPGTVGVIGPEKMAQETWKTRRFLIVEPDDAFRARAEATLKKAGASHVCAVGGGRDQKEMPRGRRSPLRN